MQTGATTMESNMEVHKKLRMDLPFDPAIPLLGIYPKEPKTLVQENISTPVFTAALYKLLEHDIL